MIAVVIRLWATHVNSDKKNSKWTVLYERLNFATAHQTVLSYLHFEGARPYDEAPSRSRSWAYHTCRPIQTTREYRDAILDMESRDLLWNIDEDKLSAIRKFVSDPVAIGPIELMPPIGTLQFSIRLVMMIDDHWAELKSKRSACICSPHYLPDNSINVYSTERENCLCFVHESGMFTKTAEKRSWLPKPCGAWRDHWWQLYDHGFVLAIPADCVIAE